MVLNLNDPVVTKLLKDTYLPAINIETWNNSGALSEAFGLRGLGGSVNATSGKLDVYFQKGKHASVGAFGDDYTFDRATLKSTGDEAVIRTRGFQANARIDIIPNQRLNGPEALENIFDNQFEDLRAALQRQYGRMLYGNGSGVITTTGLAASKDVNGQTEVEVLDVRPFEIGDIVTFMVAAGTPKMPNKVDVNGNTIEPNGAGIERGKGATDPHSPETVNQKECSKNRWATHGDGNPDFTTANANAFFTGKIEDINDDTSKLYFDELIVESTGAKAAATAVSAGAVVYYRRSIDSDIHGLDYIIRNSAVDGGSKAATRGTGYFGLGEDVYGTAKGSGRPKYLESKITTATNFLDEETFMKHIEDIELRGKEAPDFVVTSRATRRAVASTNQGFTNGVVRLMRDTTSTSANDQRSLGYGGVDLKGEPIEVDRFAPKGTLWALNLGSFEMANEQDLTFDDYNGVMWKQVLSGKQKGILDGPKRVLSYEANMYAYKELFNKNPRANGKIVITDAKVIRPDFGGQLASDIAEFGHAEGTKTKVPATTK